jgi:hypothetical protein
MTVTVTLPDGGTDEYMRSGDTYVEHGDGTLDVIRVGAKESHGYRSGEWAEVTGDQPKGIKRRFWSKR